MQWAVAVQEGPQAAGGCSVPGMQLHTKLHVPTQYGLHQNARLPPPKNLHNSWVAHVVGQAGQQQMGPPQLAPAGNTTTPFAG